MFVSVSLFRLRSHVSEPAGTDDDRTLPSSGAHAGYNTMYSPDQLAAEHSYLTFYAPTLSHLPGLRRQLVGRAFTPSGSPSPYSHIAVMVWENRAAWEAATQAGPSARLGIPPISEWAENIESFSGELADVAPPGEDSASGVLAVRLFNLKAGDEVAGAEQFYKDVFAPNLRRLPGVRRYMQGTVESLRSRAARLGRLTLIECATWDAMRAAANPQLPAGVSSLSEWADAVEMYVTEYEEIPRD